MIRIGISSCFMYPDPSRTVFGPKTLAYLEQDMAQYVARQGIMPVLIPDLPKELLDPLLQQLDGLVFQGGSDLSPTTYNAAPIANGRWKGDPQRDRYELYLFDHAIKNDLPVLAICRGMQLMNVYFGGTLYQDITTELPKARMHRSAELYDKVRHEINMTPDGLLAQLYPSVQKAVVNSVHHQAVNVLGDQLEVLARSKEDGIVEAISYTGTTEGKVLGVQWHPEFLASDQGILDPNPLFDQFLSHING